GHRIRFGVLPGQTHDLKAGPELRDDLTCEMLMGDKAFDADGVLETVAERGATAVIPPKSNRSTPRDFDHDADQERHRIETVFAKIKEAHSLATRYDKTRTSLAAGIDLMAGVVAARSLSTGLSLQGNSWWRGRNDRREQGASGKCPASLPDRNSETIGRTDQPTME
ncbi:MAG: transposase, partial [Rhodobacteraceae bacterium]|nr:transposase [Paracoccaceae bacterium]